MLICSRPPQRCPQLDLSRCRPHYSVHQWSVEDCNVLSLRDRFAVLHLQARATTLVHCFLSVAAWVAARMVFAVGLRSFPDPVLSRRLPSTAVPPSPRRLGC